MQQDLVIDRLRIVLLDQVGFVPRFPIEIHLSLLVVAGLAYDQGLILKLVSLLRLIDQLLLTSVPFVDPRRSSPALNKQVMKSNGGKAEHLSPGCLTQF